MAFNIFRAILCCCQSSDQNDDCQTYDDTMHLIIPETAEATVGTDEARLNQRRLRERLTEIVRSTEGRMVNVASQVPFNLHNRVLPKAQSHSSSRSTLDSLNPYHDHPFYSDVYSNLDVARLQKERSKRYHGLGRLRSISSSFHGSEVGPSPRTRSPSPHAEQPSAARLLNIRLVGYTDTRTRGRARERSQYPTGLPGLRKAESNTTTVETGSELQGTTAGERSPSSALPPESALQFPDVNAMILTWD